MTPPLGRGWRECIVACRFRFKLIFLTARTFTLASVSTKKSNFSLAKARRVEILGPEPRSDSDYVDRWVMNVIMGEMKWHEQILWTSGYLHMDSDYVSRKKNRYYMVGLAWNLAILNIAVGHRKIHIRPSYLRAAIRCASELAPYVAIRKPKIMSVLVVLSTDNCFKQIQSIPK